MLALIYCPLWAMKSHKIYHNNNTIFLAKWEVSICSIRRKSLLRVHLEIIWWWTIGTRNPSRICRPNWNRPRIRCCSPRTIIPSRNQALLSRIWWSNINACQWIPIECFQGPCLTTFQVTYWRTRCQYSKQRGCPRIATAAPASRTLWHFSSSSFNNTRWSDRQLGKR